MQAWEHDTLRCHRLQVVLVALAQFGAAHVLRARHVINGALHRDNSFKVKAVDVVDRTHGDLCVRVLHNAFDSVSTFADDAANQIVVGQDLQ